MNRWGKWMKEYTLLTQLGFSLITPPLVMVWLTTWLNEKFSVGIWIVVVGIVVGVLAAVSSAITFFRRYTAKEDEEDKPDSSQSTGFNSHE